MREQGQRLQARKEWPRTDSIHLRNVVNKYESLLKVFFLSRSKHLLVCEFDQVLSVRLHLFGFNSQNITVRGFGSSTQ